MKEECVVVVYVTRQADPKSTGYFSVKARNEIEQQLIGDLKRLARQDGLELADLIFEGIQYMFKAHHWPPDNPQTQLTTYQQAELPIVEKCKCGRTAIVHATDLRGITIKEHNFCQKCFSNVPGRYDSNLWKIALRQTK